MNRLGYLEDVIAGKRKPARSANESQRPTLYVPGLPDKHFYATSGFSWMAGLSECFGAMSAELTACLQRRQGFETIFPDYADAGRWAGLWFYIYGHRNDANCDAFPETARAIESVPRLGGLATLSALEPGSHVRPHCGVTNAKLRLHYALRVEPGSRMRVESDWYDWTAGDIMIFDDSYEHEVWVRGTRPRIVLLVDMYHPDLSDEEVNTLRTLETEASPLLGGYSLRSLYLRERARAAQASSADWVYGDESSGNAAERSHV